MAVTDNPRPPAALPPGTRLHEFELRRVLGIGGFGIVYLAFDHALEREVAIKEYMPSSLVGRSEGPLLTLLSEGHADSFALGLRSFVNEARLLARFDAPGLVKVHRYWEANNTAYMAMPYYLGSNLHAVRRRMSAPPDEAWLRQLLQPLLDALERLHREGIYHRDISPDNVILQPDGQPVLLDFGAARRVISDKSMALTAILKPAYAPIEQYAEAGAVKQGAWTDLYALGATLHFLLLGRAPPPATARTVDDDMLPLASQPELLACCSPGFLQALDWMLAPRPAHRPQSVAALREALQPRPPPAPADDADEAGHIELPPSAPARVHNDDATVLLPRRDEPTVLIPRKAAPPAAMPPNHMPPTDEPTVLIPRKPEPAAPWPQRDEPTVLMPRRAERTPHPPQRDEPTVLMPRKDAVTLELPLDEASTAAPAYDALHEPTMRMPRPGAAKPTAAAGTPAMHAERDQPMPRPAAGRPPVWWWGVAALVAAGAAAAWLLLKSPAKAPEAAGASAQPAAAVVAPAAAPAEPGSAAPLATGPAAAPAPTPAPALGPPLAGTQPATPGTTAPPAAALVVPAVQAAQAARAEKARAAAAAAAAAARAVPDAPPLRRPGTATLTPPGAAPAAEPTPATAGGPPSLATSITRLPPQAEPGAAVNPGNVRANLEAARAAAMPGAAPAQPWLRAPALALPRGEDTPVPRAVARDAESVQMRSRALSPAERCDGRSADAGQGDCVRTRREVNTNR